MKKRVNRIDKYEFKTKITEKILQIMAIGSIVSAAGFSLYGLYEDQAKKEKRELEEKSIYTETSIISEETTCREITTTISEQSFYPEETTAIPEDSTVTIGTTAEDLPIESTTIANVEKREATVYHTIPNQTTYNKTMVDSKGYQEISVEATTSYIYEVPAGFNLSMNAEGEYIAVKYLQKIAGHEDYAYQFFPEEEGYTIEDLDSYYKIITYPTEFVTYYVPEDFELVEDEDGNHYGVKKILVR